MGLFNSSSNSQAFAATFVLLLLGGALAAVKAADNNFPPFFDNLCNEVECGRGSCEASPGSPFNFKCNCDDGWKRTRLDDESDLEFLPCIIPNCSLDYSCMPAPPPVPSTPPHNTSFFDPCYWIYCGEGTCAKNKTYGHTCQCNNGQAANLLGISAFPCYPACAVNSDSCRSLGIRVGSSTGNSPGGSSSSSDSNGNNSKGMTVTVGKFHWIAALLLSSALVFWK